MRLEVLQFNKLEGTSMPLESNVRGVDIQAEVPDGTPLDQLPEDVAKNNQGFSPWMASFGKQFQGVWVPFGAAISYKVANPEQTAELPPMLAEGTDGIFLGYHLHDGCERSQD